MNLTPVISLDYLLRDKLLIWADAGETLNGIPGSINFYHNETQNWKFDLPTSSDVAAIAVDWVSRMIYWSDGTEDQISVCNIEGHYCKPVVYDRLKIKRGSFLQIDWRLRDSNIPIPDALLVLVLDSFERVLE